MDKCIAMLNMYFRGRKQFRNSMHKDAYMSIILSCKPQKQFQYFFLLFAIIIKYIPLVLFFYKTFLVTFILIKFRILLFAKLCNYCPFHFYFVVNNRLNAKSINFFWNRICTFRGIGVSVEAVFHRISHVFLSS